ncbi:MAG: hypothetical protein JNK05_04405 [Myxococcales bacterium]|nr:hypothetical protein [Myxococcales bacterium]
MSTPRLHDPSPPRSRIVVVLAVVLLVVGCGFGALVLDAVLDSLASPREPSAVDVQRLVAWREARATAFVRAIDVVIPCAIREQSPSRGTHYRLATDAARTRWFVLFDRRSIACHDAPASHWGWRYLVAPGSRGELRFPERPWSRWGDSSVLIFAVGRSPHSEARAAMALSPAAMLALLGAWFCVVRLRRSRPRGVLVTSASAPREPVLPQRRIGLRLSNASRAVVPAGSWVSGGVFLLSLGLWVALDSPGGRGLGPTVIGLFIGSIGVGALAIARAPARELWRALRPLGLARREQWTRVLEYRVLAEQDLDADRPQYSIENPTGGAPIVLVVAPDECTPWIADERVLCVWNTDAPETIHVLRRDGAPLALMESELSAMNDALRGARSS